MISCSEFELLLSAQLDDELTQEERVQLDEHLAQCAHCRALQADLSYLHRETIQLSAPVPETLPVQILETLQTADVPPSKRKYRARYWVAAAVILLLSSGAIWSHCLPITTPSMTGSGAPYDTCEIAANTPKKSLAEPKTFGSADVITMDVTPRSPILSQEEATAQLMAWFDWNTFPEDMEYWGFSLSEQAHLFRWNTAKGASNFYCVSAFDGTVTEQFYAPMTSIFKNQPFDFLPFY